jgi:hypothetical protein
MEAGKALTIYDNNLYNYVVRHRRGLITDETFNALRYANLQWLQDILEEHDDLYTETAKPDLDEETVAKYDTQKDKFPLCSVIRYRDIEIPCYDDDYGQQVFAVIDGNDVSGGAYNFAYPIEFVHAADYFLERKRIEEIEKECER